MFLIQYLYLTNSLYNKACLYIEQMFKNSCQSSRSLSWNKDLLLHLNPYIEIRECTYERWSKDITHNLRQVLRRWLTPLHLGKICLHRPSPWDINFLNFSFSKENICKNIIFFSFWCKFVFKNAKMDDLNAEMGNKNA